MLLSPPMTNFKMTVRADCAVSACSHLPPSIKVLARIVYGRDQPLDRCPQSPLVIGFQTEANFPFHQPGLFTGFWALSSWPSTFGNMLTPAFTYWEPFLRALWEGGSWAISSSGSPQIKLKLIALRLCIFISVDTFVSERREQSQPKAKRKVCL